MSDVQLAYALPYLISLAISAWLVFYAWMHRQAQGARAYTWQSLIQTLMVFGFILEMLSSKIGDKMFWDKFQWIVTSLATITIANFAVQFTGYKIKNPLVFWGLITSVPVAMILGVLTDPLHHLIYPNPHLHSEFLFAELQYNFTWPTYILAIHGYLVILYSFGLLVRNSSKSPRLYQAQVVAIIVGLSLPVASTILSLFDLRITTFRDATPFTSAIGDLVIAWAIFRYHLWDIVHIARDKIVESMDDLVFVLNEQDHIIYINPGALQILDLKPSQIIGKLAGPIFAEWPEVLAKFSQPANTNLEVVVQRNEQYLHFDVKSTLLYDKHNIYQGRIFVARDITSYAALQWKLKELNDELEQRVRERTVQLEEAYDTTLEGWARTLELRDKETEGHTWRVTELTMKLALALNIPHEDFDHVRRGAILHDIGKMAIPDEILRKPGPLTEQERDIVFQHPLIAYHLLSRISFLARALDIPYCHHEKWDGTGYPRGLKGEEIPIAARLFAVADVWDAIQSERP